MSERERPNQKHRTRQDLLRAAARLMKAGRTPTLAEVAEEALISRATAYRYFSSLEALLAEAPLDGVVPTAEAVFAEDPSKEPEERLLKANAAMRKIVWANQTQCRLMLARLLDQAAKADRDSDRVKRQNRCTDLIEAALAPSRDQFDGAVYRKLCKALALVFGTESMVVFRDVLQMEDREAWEVESWAVRAFVRAALEESAKSKRKRSRTR
ncbi:MAG: TetR/AcrR family transcriptional regulator [Acidobacteriota bacterium]